MIQKLLRLPKPELLKLASRRCKHKHTFLEHPSCYFKELNKEEKVGFLDIEASNLDANFGIMLTYCIKDGNSNKIYSGVISKEDINKYEADKTDTRVLKQCIEDMLKFDRLVAHYGKRFDFPFIRTRALICGVDFPDFGSIFIDDTWIWAKYKLKLNSNRLDTIATTLFGESDKTHLQYKYWVGGIRGDKKSLDYILKHNKIDVLELEKIYNKLKSFVKQNKSSI